MRIDPKFAETVGDGLIEIDRALSDELPDIWFYDGADQQRWYRDPETHRYYNGGKLEFIGRSSAPGGYVQLIAAELAVPESTHKFLWENFHRQNGEIYLKPAPYENVVSALEGEITRHDRALQMLRAVDDPIFLADFLAFEVFESEDHIDVISVIEAKLAQLANWWTRIERERQ